MLLRFDIWRTIHEDAIYKTWCVLFCSVALFWPIILLAGGVNVFTSGWYWLTMLF